MPGPKVIDFKIKKLYADFEETERFHYMIVRLLGILSTDTLDQMRRRRMENYEKKRHLIRQKRAAARRRR